MISDKGRQIIASVLERRGRIIKKLAYVFTPVGLGFLYVFVKVLEEGMGELGFWHYVGFGFIASLIAVPVYLWLSFAKIKRDIKTPPVFKVEVAEGLPKLKEGTYAYPIKFPAIGTLFPIKGRVGFTGEIDGKKYNLFAIPASLIGSEPVRFIAISRSSWLLGCHFKRFVIDVQRLPQDDIKKCEDNVLRNWPESDYATALIQNRAGKLLPNQIRRLRIERFKECILWVCLLIAGALILSVGCFVLFIQGILWSVIALLIGLCLFASSSYFLISTIFAKAATELDVFLFTGKVKKIRAAVFSEHQQDVEVDMFPNVEFGRERYLLSPDNLFYKIPQTLEMKYYYIVDKKAKTIINFERP